MSTLMIYVIEDSCQYCENTYGKYSGREGICPVCEKNYREQELIKYCKERDIPTNGWC